MEQFMNAVPYVLVGLVIVEAALLLYKYNRSEFDRLVLVVFLEMERRMGSSEGQEKMSAAILEIINRMPIFIRKSLSIIAKISGTDLHGITHKIAQGVYNAFKSMYP